MASLAEIMAQSALTNTDSQHGPKLAEGLAQGVQLAQHAEQIQQGQQQIEMQKQQIQQAKLEKFVTAVEKGQQYAGKAQANYYNKFLPAYKKTLGPDIDKMIPDDSLAFVTSSPENIGKFHTLVADVKAGVMTAQQAIAQLNDPIQFADTTPDMFKAVDESQKTFLGNQTRLATNAATIDAAYGRQAADVANSGVVKVKEAAGAEFAKWEGVGGAAAYDTTTKTFKDAIEKLKTGKVKIGGWTENVPWGDNMQVLARTNPELKALIDDVYSEQNIKTLSGDPNPTERQISDIRSFAIDPKLSSVANAAKLQKALNKMQTDRKNKEAFLRANGFLPQVTEKKTKSSAPAASAPKTYSIGGAQLTEDQARAFFKANPKYLTPERKKELGL